MKLIVAVAAFAVLAAGQAFAAGDQNKMVCLQAFKVDHTKTVDASNILFYMKDGKVWKSTLATPCTGIELSGFEMVGHPDEFCGGAQTVKVLTSGVVCKLGNFTPYQTAN